MYQNKVFVMHNKATNINWKQHYQQPDANFVKKGNR